MCGTKRGSEGTRRERGKLGLLCAFLKVHVYMFVCCKYVYHMANSK